MYDKRSAEAKLLPIATVAQASEFYTDEDEEKLNLKIEIPAEPPLNRLRRGQKIDSQERRLVALYLESMLKRVPSFRLWMLQIMKEDGGKAIDEIRRDPEQWILKNGLNISTGQLLQLMGETRQKIRRGNISIKDDLVRGQWTTPRIVQTLLNMTWRVSMTDGSIGFLTGDNPLFFAKGYGLIHPESEITFPLSSCTALHGCWQGPRRHLLFGEAEPALVKEINRRMIYNANRFVFFHRNADWVWTVARKSRIKLNRIRFP